MKFELEIECTPEEARKFFGLPDIIPMQQGVMDKIQEKMEDNISNMEADDLVKMWMPLFSQNITQGLGDIQKNFFSMMKMANSTDEKDK